MTTKMGRYRYWGDQKPDTSRPLLTFTRAQDAVPVKAGTAGPEGQSSLVGTLRIYGPIDSWGGYWGVSAKEVATALDLLGDVDQLVIRINSPGGETFEGRTIMNALRAHPAKCVAIVDGLAASAASYIAVGCDETVMAPGTALMIHDTHTYIYGDAAALRKQADVIESMSKSGAELYADIAGNTVDHWRELQRAETWFTAAEAVEAKLADQVGIVADLGPVETAGAEDDEPVVLLDPEGDDRARAGYDLSIFTSPGRDKAPTPKTPTAPADGPTKTEGGSAVAFSDEQIAVMRETFALPEDATEDQILAAAADAMEKATTPPVKNDATQIPEGHVTIPKAQLDDLTAGAALAKKTSDELADRDAEAFLDSVKTKFLPSSRDGWKAEYLRNPKGTKEHFEKAPELIATQELGHSEDTETELTPEDSAEMDRALAGFGLTKEALNG